MDIKIVHQLDLIPRAQWNAIVPNGDPFLSHEFLTALERNGCVGEQFGWLPYHLVAYEQETLCAALPLYLKNNSYGELVFDNSWADAYQRAGLPYFPKLVTAIPYTPATGARILCNSEANTAVVRAAMITRAIELCTELSASSWHCLFPLEAELKDFQANNMAVRLGCQFHWTNKNYINFDDFLGALTSAKRKKIKRERRYVADAGIVIARVTGKNASQQHIELADYFYRITYDKKWGYATLNANFFAELCSQLGDQVIFFFAYKNNQPVAAAICLQSNNTLYGRHWGCEQNYHSLHFELCYYQGIEHCIEKGLARFEPGAQGEHKIARGFLPTATWSAHWIENTEFRSLIERFVARETVAMRNYMQELSEHSPYAARDNQAEIPDVK